MALGTVFVLELDSDDKGYNATITQNIVSNLKKNGIYVRPLGNVIYLLASPITTFSECNFQLEILFQILSLKK